MSKKLTDPRPRYYDSRTGHYNLRFRGDTEIYSKTFRLHRTNLLQANSSLKLRRVDSTSTTTLRHLPACSEPRDQFVVSGLFEFTDIHKYNVWMAENKNGLPPLPMPSNVRWEDVDRLFVFHRRVHGRLMTR